MQLEVRCSASKRRNLAWSLSQNVSKHHPVLGISVSVEDIPQYFVQHSTQKKRPHFFEDKLKTVNKSERRSK